MSKIAGRLWSFLSHFKYVIVIVCGVAIVGFLDEDSFMKRFQYEYQIEELKAEIEKYTQRYEADSRRLKELNRNPKSISKIARERYYMKTDDEDIYVLSDDKNNYYGGQKDEAAH